jgi:hypothetical protein
MSLPDYLLNEPSERGDWCSIHGASMPCEDCADDAQDRAYQTWKESR